jgi:UDP:flavonoid glycosyltransferase YjiC (YdhE family)
VRVLFTPHIHVSHYYQMVGLAWAFRAAGHEVRIAGQPAILDIVAQSGMLAVSVGGGYDLDGASREMIAGNTALVGKVNVAAGEQLPADVLQRIIAMRIVPFVKAAQDVAGDLVGFAQWWQPDVVISDPLVYAAPLAAGVLGIPLLRHLWGLDTALKAALPGNGVSGEDDPKARWPAELIDLYASYGVPPRSHVAMRTIDICPPSMQFPGVPDRMPTRYVPYNGPGEAPSWLLDPPRRRRVAVTWGTLATQYAGREGFLVPQVLEALAGFDTEAVVTLNSADRALLPPGSEQDGTVRIVQNLPLHLLLPSCDAIIHQGGAGTTLTAAALGVPQVAVGGVADGKANAERLAATGAGVQVRSADATVEAIAAAIAVALSDDVRRAAHRLSEEIQAQPAPAETVQAIEALVKE